MRSYEDVIEEMRVDLSETRQEIGRLDEVLRPYYLERQGVMTELICTFPNALKEPPPPKGIQHRVLAYTRDGVAQRKLLVAELDRLNKVHWPTVKQRREKQIEQNGLEKAIERLTTRIQKKPQRVFEFAMEE